MMVPVGRIVIFRAVPKAELIRAIGYLTVPAMLGPVIGPPLGGFITTYFQWRWIFLINIPVGMIGLYLSLRYMQNWRDDNGGATLDVKGFILSALGSALLMLGFALVGSALVAAVWIVAMCVAGAALLFAYWRHAHHVSQPLLDLRLLAIPSYRASVVGGSLFRVGLGALPFLLPLSLQEGMGHTAFTAGLVTCASALGALTMKALAAPILHRFGYRSVLMYNAVISGLVIAGYGLFNISTPLWLMLAAVMFGGLFPSLQFTSLNTIVYADIDADQVSRATSLASVVQQLSLGMGVTIAGMTLQLSNWGQGHTHIVASDFWPAFVVIGLFSISSIIPARRLPLNAGRALTMTPSNETV
jgi:MFS family permease